MSSQSKSKKNKKASSSSSFMLSPTQSKEHSEDFVSSNTEVELANIKKENEFFKKENEDLKTEISLLNENIQKLNKIIQGHNNHHGIQKEIVMDTESSCVIKNDNKSLQSEMAASANLQSETNASASGSNWKSPLDNSEDYYWDNTGKDISRSHWPEKSHAAQDEHNHGAKPKHKESNEHKHVYDKEWGKRTMEKTFRRGEEYDQSVGNEWARRGEKGYNYPPNQKYDRRQNEENSEKYRDRYETGQKNERYFQNNANRIGNQSTYDRRYEENKRTNIIEIKGDLFTAPQDYSLAHCVAVDLRMGSGIAVNFRREFQRVDELMGQRKKVGQVAILEDKGRYIYYLVTKKHSTGKPDIRDLCSSLEEMREHVEKNQVKNIAIPRLGCGLDRLHWRDVHQHIQRIFADVDVRITVYNFTEDLATGSQDSTQKKPTVFVRNKLMKLVNIERDTLLVLFGSECGYVDDAMKELDEKFRFTQEYKQRSRNLGDVVEISKQNEMLCILIVKKLEKDFISYSALFQCFSKLKKIFRKEKFEYLGFTAFNDHGDTVTVAKIVTMLKLAFGSTQGEVWICWPQALEDLYNEYVSP